MSNMQVIIVTAAVTVALIAVLNRIPVTANIMAPILGTMPVAGGQTA